MFETIGYILASLFIGVILYLFEYNRRECKYLQQQLKLKRDDYDESESQYNHLRTKYDELEEQFIKLGERYYELEDQQQDDRKKYIADLKNVNVELQKFIDSSAYLQYNEDVKKLLIYFRSFMQNVSNYIEEQEKYLIEEKDEQPITGDIPTPE